MQNGNANGDTNRAAPAGGNAAANITSASLYVGDLLPEVTEALLFEIFNAVGPVASIRVCRNAITRKSLGYAYVNFHNVIDAERALDTMNFTSIRGRPCRIMWTMRDPTLRKSGKGNIFVKNLDATIDHKTLYDTFSMFGDILSCKVAMKEEDGKQVSLKYGFVHYSTDEAAKKAIDKVNGMEIASQKVVVEAFKPREKREPGEFTNVYFQNIPSDFTTEQLLDALKSLLEPDMELGQWREMSIKSVYFNPEANEKYKSCWGCVDFQDSAKAKEAVTKINEAKVQMDGSETPLEAFPFQSKSQRKQQNRRRMEAKRAERVQKFQGVNVYIKNLHDSIDNDRLKKEFEQFGEVTSARVMQDEQNRSKGFGFVCFRSPEQATKAITEMNTKIVEGKPLYVALHQPRALRDQQLAQRFSQQRGAQPMGQQFGGQPQRPGGMFYPPNSRGGPMNPMMGGGYNQVGYNQPMMQGGFQGMTPQGLPGNFGGRQPYGRRPNQRQMGGGYQQRQQRGPRQNNNRQQAMHGQTPGGPAMQNAPMANALQPLPPTPQQLTSKMLSNADPQKQKQLIGERVFPLIQQREPKLAGKITGMLLEMDNTELLHLLENGQALNDKINEALAVLREHNMAVGVSAE